MIKWTTKKIELKETTLTLVFVAYQFKWFKLCLLVQYSHISLNCKLILFYHHPYIFIVSIVHMNVSSS